MSRTSYLRRLRLPTAPGATPAGLPHVNRRHQGTAATPSHADGVRLLGVLVSAGVLMLAGCTSLDRDAAARPAPTVQAPAAGPADLATGQAARRAIASVAPAGPRVAGPTPTGRYLVGLPVLMWLEESSGSASRTATTTAGGVTVTATAAVVSVRWSTGDGTMITCGDAGPGRPSSSATAARPNCAHVYRHSSDGEPNGCYRGTATALWRVHWTSVSGSRRESRGQVLIKRAAPFTVRVHDPH